MRFCFVATTGRSGTRTLAEFFAPIAGCVSLHEPHPIMNGSVLIEASNGNSQVADKLFRSTKQFQIRRDVARAGAKVYLETNHQFIKSFSGSAVGVFGDALCVIELRRDVLETASSIYSIGVVPGTPMGNHWYLNPAAWRLEIGVADDLKTPRFNHPFFACLWYVLETRAKTAVFRRTNPGIAVHEMSLDSLRRAEGLDAVAEFLGLELDEAYVERFLGFAPFNSKGAWKQNALLPVIGHAEKSRMLKDLVSLIADRGIACPDLG